MNKNPTELKRPNYTIQINYSDEAKKKKLMKFISVTGDEFEISAEEMMSILVSQVNAEVLSAVFVETEKVNVVEVERQMQCQLERDYKKGEKININYRHAYPVEFALIEEAYNIAKINHDVPVFTLTKEYIDEVKKKIKPEQETFVKKFYKFFKNLKLKK